MFSSLPIPTCEVSGHNISCVCSIDIASGTSLFEPQQLQRTEAHRADLVILGPVVMQSCPAGSQRNQEQDVKAANPLR